LIFYLHSVAVDQNSAIDIWVFVHATDLLNLLVFLKTEAELHLADLLCALLTVRAIFFPCGLLIALHSWSWKPTC